MPVWKRSQGRIWSCYCIPKFWASYLYMQVIHHFINSKHILKISHFTLFEFWFHLSYYVRVIFYLKKCKCWWREVKVTPSCLTLCDPMDYTVQGILPARILEWVVAFSFSRESSQPRNQTEVPALQVDSLPAEPQRKPISAEVIEYLDIWELYRYIHK